MVVVVMMVITVIMVTTIILKIFLLIEISSFQETDSAWHGGEKIENFNTTQLYHTVH